MEMFDIIDLPSVAWIKCGSGRLGGRHVLLCRHARSLGLFVRPFAGHVVSKLGLWSQTIGGFGRSRERELHSQ